MGGFDGFFASQTQVHFFSITYCSLFFFCGPTLWLPPHETVAVTIFCGWTSMYRLYSVIMFTLKTHIASASLHHVGLISGTISCKLHSQTNQLHFGCPKNPKLTPQKCLFQGPTTPDRFKPQLILRVVVLFLVVVGFYRTSSRKEVAKRARMAAQSLGSASEDGVWSLTEFRWRKLEESYEQTHRIQWGWYIYLHFP